MIPQSPQLATAHNVLASPSALLLTTDGKKHHHRLKQFLYKYGHRQHPYDKEKAPYPVSYDRDVLEIEALDNRLVQHLRDSVSFVKFKEPPQRVLDLGCGTGTWVIEAAKEWPDCHFIGFDLVDVQLPLRLLDPSVASRVEWRHGNFLTSRLPFDDDEFDHVHIKSIAQGVPENKWGILFEEVNRVLRPGGSVEVIEEDMVFPWLPRWFTDALRKRPLEGMQKKNSGQGPELMPSLPPHDHALLETLYRAVFEHRFINVTPTSVLPSYITTYFRQVTLGPIVSFPMPPLPPIQPLPTELSASFISEPLLDLLDPGPSPPTSPVMMNRPISLSFSSSLSAVANGTATFRSTASTTRPRTTSAPFAYTGDANMSPLLDQGIPPSEADVTTLPVKRYIIDDSLSEGEIAAAKTDTLFPMAQVDRLSERSLAMHLHRSFNCVLGCQEAMWEELKDMIRNRHEELGPLGWDDDSGELGGLEARKRFETLVERYRSDIRLRMSLWCSLEGIGWPQPPREPLTKAELVEEKRLRERMIEARKLATVEDMHVPCRSVRVILGYKL